MPAKKPNVIEQHFEKGVLALAAVVLLYMGAAYLVGSPVKTMIGTETVGPGEAYARIGEMAQRVDEKARRQAVPENIVVENTTGQSGQTKSQAGQSLPTTLPAVVQRVKESEGIELGDPNTPYRRHDLVKVVTPVRLAVHQGRSTIEVDPRDSLAQFVQASEGRADMSWVTVVGEVNLEEQKKLMADLPDTPGKEPHIIRVDLQRALVDEQGHLGEWEDVAPLDPAALLAPPDKPLKLETFQELKNLRAELLRAPSQWQVEAANPYFPRVMAGAPWNIPTLAGEKPVVVERPVARRERPAVRRVTQPTGMGPGAGPGAGPGIGPDRDRLGGGGGGGGGGAYNRYGAPGGANERRLGNDRPRYGGEDMMPPMGMPAGPGMMEPGMERMPTPAGPGTTGPKAELEKTETGVKVWAHDLFATPGRAYRYRMRIVIYNSLAGWPLYMKDQSNVLLAGLSSEWSEPTNPVIVEEDIYFFVSRPHDERKAVKVDVYKWSYGWLCNQSFTVEPGEMIGGPQKSKYYVRDGESTLQEMQEVIDFSTGAVLVDVTEKAEVTVRDPSGRGGEFEIRAVSDATVMVVRDLDGKLIEQDTESIRSDPGYKYCRDKMADQRMEMRRKNVVRWQDARQTGAGEAAVPARGRG